MHGLELLSTGSRYPLSRFKAEVGVGRVLSSTENRAALLFAVVKRSNFSALYVCPGSQKLLFNLRTSRTTMVKRSVLEAITTYPDYMFI